MNTFEEDGDELLLYTVVYCSCASGPVHTTEIDRIVSVARRNNARDHITGWLVYSSGIFFQWLEGTRDEVRRLMAVIAADSRHNSVVVLSEEEEMRERLFSEWDMELVSPADIRAVLSDALGESSNSKSSAALQRLIQELDARQVAG